MSTITKKPYEISVWGDRKVYVINGEKRYAITGEDHQDYLFDEGYMKIIHQELNKGFNSADWQKVFKFAGYRDKKIANKLVTDPRWNIERSSIRYVFYFWYWGVEKEQIENLHDRVTQEILREDEYYATYWSKFEIVVPNEGEPETGQIRLLSDENPSENYLPDYYKNIQNFIYYLWYVTGYDYIKEDNYVFQNGGYMNEIIKEINRKPVNWETIFTYAGYRDKKIANKWSALKNMANKIYDELPRSSIRFVTYLYYIRTSGEPNWSEDYWEQFKIKEFSKGILEYTEEFSEEGYLKTNSGLDNYNLAYTRAYENYNEDADTSASINYLTLIFNELAENGDINWPVIFKLAGLRDKRIGSGGINGNSSLAKFNIPRSSIRFVCYYWYLAHLNTMLLPEKMVWDRYLRTFSIVDQKTGQIQMKNGQDPTIYYLPANNLLPPIEKTWYEIGYSSELIQNQFLEEVKLATVGTHLMDSPIRVFNPILTEDLNGSHTLTFQMFYKFWDEETETYKENPFLRYLVNERKIKLFRKEDARQINWEYIFKLAGYRDWKIYNDWLAYEQNPSLIVYAKKRSSIRFVTYLWYEYTYGRITKDDKYWETYWKNFDIVSRKTGQIESHLEDDEQDYLIEDEDLSDLIYYNEIYTAAYEKEVEEGTAFTTNYMQKIIDLGPQATDDDGWLDFVIKQIDEDTKTYTNTYTCKDLFINELGKTGYDVELNDELQNNMGSVFDLGDTILENSDWHIDREGSDIIRQTNKESLYRYVTTFPIEATCMVDFNYKYKKYERGSSLSIPAGETIYIFYSCYSNKEQEVQFYYLKDSDLPYKTDSDGFIINSPNYKTLTDAPILFYSEEPEISTYMGEKLTTHQLSKYIPEIGETCYLYEQEGANLEFKVNYFQDILDELDKTQKNWNKIFKIAGKRDKKIISQNVDLDYRVPRASIRYVFYQWYEENVGVIDSNDKYYNSYWSTFEIITDEEDNIYVKMIDGADPNLNYIPNEYLGAEFYEYYLQGYALTSERYYCYETLKYPSTVDIQNYITNGTNFTSLMGWTALDGTIINSGNPDVIPTINVTDGANYGYITLNCLSIQPITGNNYFCVCNSGLYDNREMFSDGLVEGMEFIFAIKYQQINGTSNIEDVKILTGKVEDGFEVSLESNGKLKTNLTSVFDFVEMPLSEIPSALSTYKVLKGTCNKSISYTDLIQNYPILNLYIIGSGNGINLIDTKFFPYDSEVDDDIITADDYMKRLWEELKVNYNTNWQLIFRIAGKRDKKIADKKVKDEAFNIPRSSLRYVFFHWYTAVNFGNIYDYASGRFKINSTAQLISIMENAEELEEVPYRDYWESFEILEDEHGKIRFNGLNPEDNFIPSDYTDNSYYNYFYLEEYNSSETVLVPDTINPLRVPYNFFEYHDDETIPEDEYIQSLKEAYETGFSDAQEDIVDFKEKYLTDIYNIYYENSSQFYNAYFKKCFYSNYETFDYEMVGEKVCAKLKEPTYWSAADPLSTTTDLNDKYIALIPDESSSQSWVPGLHIYKVSASPVVDINNGVCYIYASCNRLEVGLQYEKRTLEDSPLAPIGTVTIGGVSVPAYNKVYGQVKNIWNDPPIPKTDIMKVYSASEQVISPDWLTHINNKLLEYKDSEGFFKKYKNATNNQKASLMGMRDRKIADGYVKDERWNIPRSSARYLCYDLYNRDGSLTGTYWDNFSVVDDDTAQILMSPGINAQEDYIYTGISQELLEQYEDGYNFWINLFTYAGYRDAKLDYIRTRTYSGQNSYDSLNYIFNEWYLTTGQWGEQASLSPSVTIKIIYNFFPEDYELSGVTSKEDLQLTVTQKNTNGFIPVYDPDYQKITSISGEKSNRFNLIQDCCEAFECWAKFIIKHNKKGQTTYSYKALENYSDVIEGGRYYFKATNNTDLKNDCGFYIVENPVPEDYYLYYKRTYDKTVIFKEFIGQENFSGFRYGINLESIQRKNISDQIASKVIIQPNANEFAPNGSCSIQQAKLNPTGENFIYNFNYYINQGLLNKEEVFEDLYGTNNGLGLYPHLREWNNMATYYIDAMAAMIDGLTKLESQQQVYDALLAEAQKEKNKLDTELGAINYNTDGADDGGEYVKNLVIRRDIQADTIKYNKGLSEKNKNTLKQYTSDYQQITNSLDEILQSKKALINDFQSKYYAYIQEGTWTSEDYYDPNLYYDAANSVLYTSCFPQVSYTINVLELSKLDGYSSYKFKIGDKTYIEDTEYFGWDSKNRPYQEEIVVSQIQSSLDDASKNTITVQNYKTQFQDLFQRVAAASQTLQYNEGIYSRAVGVINLEGSINSKLLENSLKENSLIVSNARNQSVVWGDTGITISNFVNPNEIVRLTSLGIAVSTDGGKNWTTGISGQGINADVITTGRLDTNLIRIFNDNQPTFEWNKDGISAFSFDSQNRVDRSSYVRFNQYGLFGFQDEEEPTSIDDVIQRAIFSLTWKGLSINLPIKENGDPVLRIGDSDSPVFEITSDGFVTIRGGLKIQQHNGTDYIDVLSVLNNFDAETEIDALKLSFLSILNADAYKGFGMTERSEGKIDIHYTTDNKDVYLQINGNPDTPNGESIALINQGYISDESTTWETKFYVTCKNVGIKRSQNGTVEYDISLQNTGRYLRLYTSSNSGTGYITKRAYLFTED